MGMFSRMLGVVASVALLAAGWASASPADDYLNLMDKVIKQTRDDLPQLIPLAEKCADQLIETSVIGSHENPDWGISEVIGRAGGLMKMAWGLKPDQRGVLFYFPTQKCEDLEQLLAGKSYVYAVCPRKVLERGRDSKGQPYDLTKLAGILGGPMPDQGLYPDAKGVLSAPAYQMGQLVRVWAFTGELVAACTRKGKMPMIWKSVTLPDAGEWNEPLQAKRKQGVVFHDDLTVKPVPAGYMAKAYLDAVARDVTSFRQTVPAFQRAGRAMAQALRDGHRIHVLVGGHAFPGLIESRPVFQMPTYFADYAETVKDQLQPGDAQVVIPYRSVPMEPMAGTLDKVSTIVGAQSIPEGLADKPNVITFTTRWIRGDALVPIEGYPVNVLPESSFVQATAFFCMTAEMGLAEQEVQKAQPPK
jgi:hypothetical protein